MAKKTPRDKNISVVLLDDIQKVGQRGEMKRVKRGFFRYLFGLGKVMRVTPRNLPQIEKMRILAEKNTEQNKEKRGEIKNKIEGLTFETAIRIGEHGEVYSSVNIPSILKFLKENNVIVKKNDVELSEPIRKLGNYVIPIHLGYGIIGSLSVVVKKEPVS